MYPKTFKSLNKWLAQEFGDRVQVGRFNGYASCYVIIDGGLGDWEYVPVAGPGHLTFEQWAQEVRTRLQEREGG